MSIFDGIRYKKQKGANWYISRIFSYFFRHVPNFCGIKPLNHCFWEFCPLEFIEEINSNSFMLFSTNSDAFQSLKKLVSKFDDFDCQQLYPRMSYVFLYFTFGDHR